jgi:hypothetical protein
MAAKATVAEQLRQLLQAPTVTMRKLSASLNVPERTLRRWKNEGTNPSPKHFSAIKKLRRAYTARSADQRNFARQKSHTKAYNKISTYAAVPDRTVKVVPTIDRVRMSVVEKGKRRYVGSPFMRVDVRRLTKEDTLTYLISYFKKRQRFGQDAVTYALVEGNEYPGAEKEGEGKHRWRTSLEIHHTEADLRRWVGYLYRSGNNQRPLEIFVKDAD